MFSKSSTGRRSLNQVPIDHEVWRAANAIAAAFLKILDHRIERCLGLHAGIECLHIQAQVRGRFERRWI